MLGLTYILDDVILFNPGEKDSWESFLEMLCRKEPQLGNRHKVIHALKHIKFVFTLRRL